jgi:replicative DNA helicase Mcm
MARVKLPPEKSRGGDSHVDVHFYDDMANTLEGNERVELTGELTLDTDDTDSTVFDYQLDTKPGAVEVTEGGYEDVDIDKHLDEIKEIAARDDPVQYLVDNFAPGLYLDKQLETAVTGVVLQLVGAGRKDPERGATFRGDIHLLLLGDPGGGKSQVLDYAEELSPRSKSASGKGLSKAGATAAAVRNDFGPQEWTLKAGLLVLANNGLACLDEIDKVDPDARSSMHSALARQRVDVVKAGIDASLPARTSLLAAGNPKYGRFDQYEPIGEQIDLPPSLMSRFDLMFMISDQPDEERDAEIASHVGDAWDTAARKEYGRGDSGDSGERDIPAEVYKAYIAYARERVHPVIEDPEVFNRIINHYVEVRSKGVDDDSPVPITARKLEAFFRLSEASARARLSESVDMQDAERAIELVMSALEDIGVDPETGEFDADVVETGESKSQRDRKKAVKAVIQDVEEEHDGGAPVDAVRERAEAIGIDTTDLEHDLDKLAQKGEVYENETDRYRVT